MGKTNQSQASPALRCPACGGDILIAELQSELMNSCPACEKPLTVRWYPALTRKETAKAGRRILLEEESACFFHESKQAESLCEDCGRYLCALCEIVFEGKTLCPACLETAQEKESMDGLVHQRFRHDSLALMLALWPFFLFSVALLAGVMVFGDEEIPQSFFFFTSLLVSPTIITAPVAVVYAIFLWNSAGSLVRSGKWRFVAAILLGLPQIGYWLWWIFFVGYSKYFYL